jgi:hypothetical protein
MQSYPHTPIFLLAAVVDDLSAESDIFMIYYRVSLSLCPVRLFCFSTALLGVVLFDADGCNDVIS